MDLDLREEGRISQRFENLSIELVPKVDKPLDSLFEANEEKEIINYFDGFNLGDHHITPSLQFC